MTKLAPAHPDPSRLVMAGQAEAVAQALAAIEALTAQLDATGDALALVHERLGTKRGAKALGLPTTTFRQWVVHGFPLASVLDRHAEARTR